MNDSAAYTHPLITFCEGANRRAAEFRETLSALEPGSAQRKEFLKAHCYSENELLQIQAFGEIGKSGDPSWLPFLFERLKTEPLPTIVGPIFCAIGSLGGFQSEEDYTPYLESSDQYIRMIAMQILAFLPREEAIERLLNILNQDQDSDLRRLAAQRLAELNSDAGLPILLKDLENQDLPSFARYNIACNLAQLNHPVGLHFLQHHIETHLTLSKLNRSNLFGALCSLFLKAGIELPRCEHPGDFPLESFFQTASEWIEMRLKESRV